MPSKRKFSIRDLMAKIKILFLLLLFGAILSTSSAFALEVSEVTVDFPLSEVLDLKVPKPDTSVQVNQKGASVKMWRPDWENNWYAYRQNVLRGNFSEAGKQLDQVLTYRKKRNIPDLFETSAALLMEASNARNQGRYDDALKFIGYAKEMAPDDPGPHFERALTIWEQSKLRVLSSLDALLEGWGVFYRDFKSVFPWGIGVLLWLLIAMTISSILTILLFTPRVIPRIAHDLSHIIKVPQVLWLIGIPVVLAAVVLSGVPVVIWVLIVALTMALHLTNRERVVVTVALLFLMALPLLVHLFAISKAYFSDSTPYTIYMAERGGEGAKTLEVLHRLRVKEPGNSQVLATIGLVLKRSGRLRESESFLLQALEATPDSPAIINNLGNVLLQEGHIDKAIEYYRQAIRYQDDPRIHYNLSQALRENLQLEEGEREFKIAQEKMPGLEISLRSQQQAEGQRITIDIYGNVHRYLLEALTLDENGKIWRENLWSAVVPFLPFRISWLLFPGAAAILLLVWPLSTRMNLSRRCRRCNKMHCHKCSQSSSDSLCAQCRQIFIVRSGVDPASRVRKMMQIMRFTKTRALVARVATILLPGMGHIYLGAGWQSLFMIMITVLFWTKWVLWYGIFRNTTMLDIQAGIFSKVLFGVLLGAFYLLALRGVSNRLEEN